MESINVKKTSELNKIFRNVVYYEESELPLNILYCEGIGSKTYKITIDLVDIDTFTDGKGQIWKRQISEEV